MDAFVYCRTNFAQKNCSLSDRWESQQKRCHQFAKENHLNIVRVYREGGLVPSELLQARKRMIRDLIPRHEVTVVLCDHPARLAACPRERARLIEQIEDFGGRFTCVYADPSQNENSEI